MGNELDEELCDRTDDPMNDPSEPSEPGEPGKPGKLSDKQRPLTVSCYNCLTDIYPTELSQIRAEVEFDLVCLKCRDVCWHCQNVLSDHEKYSNNRGGIRWCEKCHSQRASLFV